MLMFVCPTVSEHCFISVVILVKLANTYGSIVHLQLIASLTRKLKKHADFREYKLKNKYYGFELQISGHARVSYKTV